MTESSQEKRMTKAVSGHFLGTPEELRAKLLTYASEFSKEAILYYWNCEMKPCTDDYCSTEVTFR